MDWGNLEGLIPLLGGVFYAMLLGAGVLPRKPKNPERMALWRKKFGGVMLLLGPALIVFGVLQLVGVV